MRDMELVGGFPMRLVYAAEERFELSIVLTVQDAENSDDACCHETFAPISVHDCRTRFASQF